MITASGYYYAIYWPYHHLHIITISFD